MLPESPKVSVIIPVYEGRDFLPATLRSVLAQTYPYVEVIVVDDASPDDTFEVLGEFRDPRLHYLRHDENKGADAARNTGILASTGDILAFLDQDDIFHPEKLQIHVNYLKNHPEVGLSYNSRFELNHSASSIRTIWQPPMNLSLAEIVLGHQLSPSDIVARRDWVFKVGLWKADHPFIGSEIIFLGRLILLGCKFAHIGRVLNSRRYHSGRIISHLMEKYLSEREARRIIFDDPRFPAELSALREISYSNNALGFAFLAFSQQETGLGIRLIKESVTLNPNILKGEPCKLIEEMIHFSILDETQDFEALLQSMFSQLPDEMQNLTNMYEWAIGRGYLLKACRAIIWKRIDAGHEFFQRARKAGAHIDNSFLGQLIGELLIYEDEFGPRATAEVLRRFYPFWAYLGHREAARFVRHELSLGRVFWNYSMKNYPQVPGAVLRAFVQRPGYMSNRGAWSILLHSLLNVAGRSRSN